MITNFFIEESHIRFTNPFNKLYDKHCNESNEILKKLIDKCEKENIKNYYNRKLYIIDYYEEFMNTIEFKDEKFSCFKYITKDYYNKYKNIYDKLFELKFYNIQGYKQMETERLEAYIFKNLEGRKIFEGFDIKINFVKENIHSKINVDKLKFIITSQTKGTFIDYCIKYIINNEYDFAYNYLLTCDKSIDYNNLPDNLKNCENTKDCIDLLFEKDFTEKILKIKNKFPSVKTTECYINFDLLIYGEPDLIADDYIIDIKTTENKKIDSKANFIQTLFYAMVANKKNICLYDPINGDLYKYQITEQNIIDMTVYINSMKALMNLKNKKNIKNNLPEVKDYYEKDFIKNLNH